MNKNQTQKVQGGKQVANKQPLPNNAFDKEENPKENQQQRPQKERRRRQEPNQLPERKQQLNVQKKKDDEKQTKQLQTKDTAFAQPKGKPKGRPPNKKRQSVNVSFLYDTKQSHPIIEYLPSKEDSESASLTPSFVLEVTWPRIIQFYHPSSPRCLALQSIYVEVARGIKRRSSRLPVEFHAVNCGVYRQVCEQGFNVKSVPTIIGLRSGRIDGTEIILPGSMGVGAADSKEDTKEDVEIKVKYIAQMMRIPLDILKGNKGSAFARPMGVDVDSEIDINAAFGTFSENSIESSIPISDQVFHDAKSSLLATLTSSLYSQFPGGSALPRDTSRAFEEFLDLIRWAFPPETQVHDLAEDLKLDYRSVSTSESELLKVVEKHMYMGKVAWSQRCGATPNGGFSCGLWTLLHILSIGVAERHTSVVGDAERVSVIHAGQVIRSFINNFFIGCNTCKESWIKLYDEACCGLDNSDHSMVELDSDKGDDWRNLAIWIWKVHNEISVLRQKSKGQSINQRKPRMALSLWPSKKDCPKCWRSLTDDTGLAIDMDSYDREELYNHLKKTYWPAGVHNNRLIVLDRWSKAKRAMSMKRLRARMAAHDWTNSILVLHLVAAYLICRMAFPCCNGRLVGKKFSRVMYGTRPVRKRKKKVKLADQMDLDGRHRLRLYSDKWEDTDHYVRNKYSPAPRSRKSIHTSGHMAPSRGDNVSGGYQYRSRPYERRRRYAGSGYHKPQKHSFDHFIEL